LANQLSESSLGLHSLIIYPDLTTLREFYSYYIQKQIKEKNELVFVSPFYETTDSVRHNLSNGYKTIDVDKYERQEKKLVIMDSLDKYLGQREKDKDKGKVSISEGDVVAVPVPVAVVAVVGDASNLTTGSRVKDESQWWSYNEQMIKHAAKMGGGLSILGDMGVFYYLDKTKELLEYESSLPKQFDANLNLNLNLKGLCLYHQTDFDKLSKEQKQELVKHHGMAVLLQAH
jgi:hypothetical protein